MRFFDQQTLMQKETVYKTTKKIYWLWGHVLLSLPATVLLKKMAH